MGDAVTLLIGGPPHLYVVGFAIGCAALETFSRYERYVVLLKWSSGFLLAYVATALVVDTPWGLVARNTFIPTFRLDTDYVVAIVAVLGHHHHAVLLLLAVVAGSRGRAHRSARQSRCSTRRSRRRSRSAASGWIPMSGWDTPT